MKIMLPIIVAAFALFAVFSVVIMRWKNQHLGDRNSRAMKETQENQQNAETQRERYYATIHKVAFQQTAGDTDKIPGEYITQSFNS